MGKKAVDGCESQRAPGCVWGFLSQIFSAMGTAAAIQIINRSFAPVISPFESRRASVPACSTRLVFFIVYTRRRCVSPAGPGPTSFVSLVDSKGTHREHEARAALVPTLVGFWSEKWPGAATHILYFPTFVGGGRRSLVECQCPTSCFRPHDRVVLPILPEALFAFMSLPFCAVTGLKTIEFGAWPLFPLSLHCQTRARQRGCCCCFAPRN